MVLVTLFTMFGIGLGCRGLVHSKWWLIVLGLLIVLAGLYITILVTWSDVIDYRFPWSLFDA